MCEAASPKLADSSGPLLDVVQVGPLSIGIKIFSAIALLAVANGAPINLIMASRLLYGMARQRILPRVFERVLPVRRTPWVAIAFTTLIAAALIVVGKLDTLADTTVLRARAASRRRRARSLPGATAIPVIGVVVIVLLLTQTEARIFGWGAALLAIGVVLHALNWAFGGGRGPTDPLETGEFRV